MNIKMAILFVILIVWCMFGENVLMCDQVHNSYKHVNFSRGETANKVNTWWLVML